MEIETKVINNNDTQVINSAVGAFIAKSLSLPLIIE